MPAVSSLPAVQHSVDLVRTLIHIFLVTGKPIDAAARLAVPAQLANSTSAGQRGVMKISYMIGHVVACAAW
jgi:hypothetical protein